MYCKQIVYVLRAELSGNQNDAAIAAACLLSLLTGLSPVALMDFERAYSRWNFDPKWFRVDVANIYSI